MKHDLPSRSRLLLTGAVVVALGAGVTTAAVLVGATDGPGDDGGAQGISLVSYDTCDAALAEMKARLRPYVGPYGLDAHGGGRADEDVAIAEDGAGGGAEDSAGGGVAGAPAAGAPFDSEAAPKQAEPNQAPPDARRDQAPDHSTTNNHEATADEPDLVKTDGTRVVTVADGVLRVVDVKSRRQTAAVRLDNGHASQLLLSGDRALVLASTGVAVDMPAPRIAQGEPMPVPPGKPTDTFPYQSQIVLVDLTGAGKVLGTLALDGMYLDARQVGSVARVVVRSAPRLGFAYPQYDGNAAPALLANQTVVDESTIADWLPRYELTTGGATSSGQLTTCGDVSHPVDYTASSMLTVLTFDLGLPELGTGDAVTIVADGNTVYGNAANLYIADDHSLPGMGDVRTADGGTTELYQFSISGSAKPVHVATGSVPGHLLNQYSLSEYDGHLRVATTVSRAEGSVVTVLARKEDKLAEVGKVGGLGLDERIYAVRYFGPTAYVVTFRETDPLYTVDLSNPAAPKVTGELKIPGYSAYLHPAGDGRLIGVGQEADLAGQRMGAQISLFDTSNPAGATRVAQYHLQDAWTEVEADPHAFLFWPDKGLVVMPVSSGGAVGPDGPVDGLSGALVLRLDGDAFQQVGILSHISERYGSTPLTPRRAIVIGAELWTVSEAGMLVNDLDSLAQLAWLPFT